MPKVTLTIAPRDQLWNKRTIEAKLTAQEDHMLRSASSHSEIALVLAPHTPTEWVLIEASWEEPVI